MELEWNSTTVLVRSEHIFKEKLKLWRHTCILFWLFELGKMMTDLVGNNYVLDDEMKGFVRDFPLMLLSIRV